VDIHVLPEKYRFILEKRLALPNDPQSYIGGNVISW
jgi:hypothetical protein